MTKSQKAGFFGGIIISLIIFFFVDLDPKNAQVTKMAAIASLMAIWWLTEAIPLAVTYLLPLILFPVMGVIKGDEIASTYINDVIFLFLGGFLLFLIPSKKEKKKMILDSEIFSKVPWGIILLFGGGFALAEGFTTSGLSEFIGTKFFGMKDFSPILITISVAFVVIFLTELTSNTAVAQMILPIMASVSVALGINPLLLMITATISSSLGFMMPVGTPPNTIVFASERLKISDMVKAGFAINIVSIILVSLLVYLLGNILFDLGTFPDWAR